MSDQPHRPSVGGGLSPDPNATAILRGVKPLLPIIRTPDSNAPAIPERGQQALRRGRFSQANASYFITLCTLDRNPGLAESAIFDGVLGVLHALETEDVLDVRCLTIMPDHLHLVMRLGHSETLSESIRLLKGRTSVLLRHHGLAWQRGGFYDHRLRPDEPLGAVFRYIFLNPYRRNLLSAEQAWPFFHCCPEDWAWFQHETKAGAPYPEWLDAGP